MKAKLLLLAAVGLCGGLAACHDDSSSAPPPPASTTQALDTAQVLALAQQTSETSSPFVVNGGALTLTDTSETTFPLLF